MSNKVSWFIIICCLFVIHQPQIGAEARKLVEDIHIPPTTTRFWSTTTQGISQIKAAVHGSGAGHSGSGDRSEPSQRGG
ncbi:hypothetical protein M5689_007829 [Euphorbia peplus]|nr:hypothetical protein M5689_007829 [Euphorbia peplus]